MRASGWCAALSAGLLLLTAGHASAGPTRTTCPFATDDAGDSWPAGLVGPAASAASGNLDLTRLELSSTARTVTARITVRDLSQTDPGSTVGAQYDVRAVVAMKRIHLDAMRDATGTTFYAFAEDLDEGTGEPSAVQTPGTSQLITGRWDERSSTITLTAPLSAFGFRVPLRPGRDLKKWFVASYRMVGAYAAGGTDLPGDHLSTSRAYALGDQSCGRLT